MNEQERRAVTQLVMLANSAQRVIGVCVDGRQPTREQLGAATRWLAKADLLLGEVGRTLRLHDVQ